MPEISKEIIINAPAETVFEFLLGLENYPSRFPTVKEAAPMEEGQLKLGSRFRTLNQSKGRQFEIVFEVSRFENNRVFGTTSVSGSQPFEEIYRLEEAEGGTKVTLSASGEMPGLMKLLSGRFKKLLKKQVGNDLERLKDLLETDE